MIAAMPAWQAGVFASLLAGLAAGVGALPIYLLRNVSQRSQDIMLGYAGGVMLAATAFSLFLPGIEAGSVRWGGILAALAISCGAFAGAAILWFVHRHLPHEHFVKGPENVDRVQIDRLWLFVLAIALHNFPEGLAVGVGVGSGDLGNALSLIVAMFLQNLPEGFVVALALLPLGYSRTQAALLALGTGVVETAGGMFGSVMASLADAMLPFSLAAAGGAMLFVTSHEVIPETHRNGHETPATFGLMGGFMTMMILDVVLS